MGRAFTVVDLFSGPGGLGEGFSAFKDSAGSRPFTINVSVEKDPAAHATLRLRSFLRKFEPALPPEYYAFLNGRTVEPDWKSLYPDEWSAAEDEARCMELGTARANDFLSSRIAGIRERSGGRTLLIGGPPCQAYSLAGRSRNAGIAGYVPHKDDRNYLYQKYVDVLRQLEPAAFVMENVKGMLSSAIRGDKIFQSVLSDLESAAGPDSYRLLALTPDEPLANRWMSKPSDFVVRMENHGVPQARHRVIIIGLRREIADTLEALSFPRLERCRAAVNVASVIGMMPALRSGLSRNDDCETWSDAIVQALRVVSRETESVPRGYRSAFKAALRDCRKALEQAVATERSAVGGTRLPESCPKSLRSWITDEKIDRLPNNETRGHMPSDLARYLFASAYGIATGRSPKASEFPEALAPNHRNWKTGKFSDRFRVQVADRPASTVTSHISKDGHYFIHPDPSQCRSLTVREAARLQTFPDNYFFKGNRTEQYVQVGNAVPPYLALQIAESLWGVLEASGSERVRNVGRNLQKTI